MTEQTEPSPSDPAVRAAFADLLPVLIPHAQFDAAADEVVVAVDGGRARIAVASLLDAASRMESVRWPQLIEAWCGTVLEQLRQPVIAPTTDQFRLRLVPRAEFDSDQMIVKPWGAYFQLELMADLDGRRIWVGPRLAGELGLSTDDAWSTGLRNTIQQVLVGLVVRQHEVGNGLVVSVAAADDTPWVSAGVTSVVNLFRAGDLPYGALVAVPRLSTVMFSPVESDRVTADVLLLGRLVADLHADSSDRCSPEVFWFYDGSLYRVERGEGNKVTLPVELESVFASLPPA